MRGQVFIMRGQVFIMRGMGALIPIPTAEQPVRQLGPQMLDGTAREFGSDEGFHEVEQPVVAEKAEYRFGPHVHDVDVVVDRSVFPGDQGQAPLERFALV